MTSNLILSGSQSPISRRSAKDSATKKFQVKMPRKSSSLPTETVDYLKAWMMSPQHIAHPYPTEQEKAKIMADTGIELKQLTNWFVNNRKRYWKPRVEARLQQQQAQVTASAVSKAVSPTKFVSPTSTGAPYIALDMTQPSAVNMVNASAFVSLDRSRSPRAVSIGSSSFASESDDASIKSNESDDGLSTDVVDQVESDSQMIKRTETLDVHILRPTGSDPIPTVADVTVLSNVPSDRIIKSYESCTMSYRFHEGAFDRKEAQLRRDSEIVKMKKQYLKKFLAETAAAAAGLTTADEPQKASTKRSRSSEEDEVATKRPKYLRQSPPLWRDACRSASNIYDRELPSLEEASHLFGYSAV